MLIFTHYGNMSYVAGFFPVLISSGGVLLLFWGMVSWGKRISGHIMRNNIITRSTWWLPHYEWSAHWLLPRQDRRLLKDALCSFWMFIISRSSRCWHLKQKPWSDQPQACQSELRWAKNAFSFFYPRGNILFTWPRIMTYNRKHIIFANLSHTASLKLIFVQPGSRKRGEKGSLHSCFRHFWDRPTTSKRKTCIIDKDMVGVPLGLLCVHDDLMCSLWQAQPIPWPDCQTFPIKPVIIHVA